MRAIRDVSAVLAMAALVLAGCGEDPDEAAIDEDPVAADEGADEPASDEDAEPATGDEDAEPGGGATVGLADTELGEVLVDGDGRTLYLFDPDEQGPSTCEDECADNWPPLIDADPMAGDGVDDALLSTAERPDGEPQVTYDGWPLYRWIGDEEPGDVTGQGVQDVWWVLAADGAPLRGDAPAEEDADDGSVGGY